MIVGEKAAGRFTGETCKAKHLTNMRSQGEGNRIQLEAPLKMSLERGIEYIKFRRVHGSHAKIAADAQTDSKRHPTQAGRECARVGVT